MILLLTGMVENSVLPFITVEVVDWGWLVCGLEEELEGAMVCEKRVFEIRCWAEDS
jgi:hypothetical protein